MVKALDLRSNVRMHTWVRTPFLVWEPGPFFIFFTCLFSTVLSRFIWRFFADTFSNNIFAWCILGIHVQWYAWQTADILNAPIKGIVVLL